MGSTAFWGAMRQYVADNRFKLSTTERLLTALDAATPKDLAALLFGPRFPRIY
jgi:aminopeptidase N